MEESAALASYPTEVEARSPFDLRQQIVRNEALQEQMHREASVVTRVAVRWRFVIIGLFVLASGSTLLMLFPEGYIRLLNFYAAIQFEWIIAVSTAALTCALFSAVLRHQAYQRALAEADFFRVENEIALRQAKGFLATLEPEA